MSNCLMTYDERLKEYVKDKKYNLALMVIEPSWSYKANMEGGLNEAEVEELGYCLWRACHSPGSKPVEPDKNAALFAR